jgi:hypothetical protein
MTNKQMLANIKKTANSARKAGQNIEINFGLPYVSINRIDTVYFFQGDEASNILEEAINAGNKFNCSTEDYLLYISQGW